MNAKMFYDSVRHSLFDGKIKGGQMEGIQAVINEYNSRCVNDLRMLAYILATVYHETAKTMQPIAEYGKGVGRTYGRKIKMSGEPYTTPNQIYYGRGLVQLTWLENYASMGKIIGVDLLNNPDKMLDMGVSVKVLFEGMIRGSFTGRKLSSYFTPSVTDWINARRIINGLDAALMIRDYAKLFYTALTLN